MRRRIFPLLLILTIFTQCKKENDHPQWDVNVLGPLLHAKLTLAQLAGDSNIVANGNGAQILDYDSTFSILELDSLYQVADTTIPTTVTWLAFPTIMQPNTPFNINNNKISLGIGSLQLKKATISSGTIRLDIKNTLQSKVIFTYEIPGAKKNGQVFSVVASVDSGSKTDPKYFSHTYDFSGYDLDLTGTGLQYNTVLYNVIAKSDPNGQPFPVDALDTLVNLKTSLIDIRPSFVQGYLGQENTSSSTQINAGIGGLIKNGTINLDSIEMKLDLINYIGADAQVLISSFNSLNNRTGSTVNLVAPSFLQNYININRASLNTNLSDPVIPTHYNIALNRSNSNIKDLIENLPDKLNYDINLALNPLGNVSGNNDFIYSDRLLKTRLQVVMPLNFALNQLIISDTLDFSISNATDFDAIGESDLTLVAENGFPFDMNVQMFLLDSTLSIVDSLFVPDYIPAAPYDGNYRSTGVTRTQINIHVDADRKKRLLSVKQIGIHTRFNTPDYPQLIQMYSDYSLDLKLIADGLYSIR